MDEFYKLPGLKVSYAQSEVFFSGVLPKTQVQLAALLNLKISKLPRYLGVSLIIGELKFEDCKPLVKKLLLE